MYLARDASGPDKTNTEWITPELVRRHQQLNGIEGRTLSYAWGVRGIVLHGVLLERVYDGLPMIDFPSTVLRGQ